MFSRSIWVVALELHFFLWLNNIPCRGRLFIQSSFEGRVDYFHFLAVEKNAALHIHVRVCVWTDVLISLDHTPSGGTAGS